MKGAVTAVKGRYELTFRLRGGFLHGSGTSHGATWAGTVGCEGGSQKRFLSYGYFLLEDSGRFYIQKGFHFCVSSLRHGTRVRRHVWKWAHCVCTVRCPTGERSPDLQEATVVRLCDVRRKSDHGSKLARSQCLLTLPKVARGEDTSGALKTPHFFCHQSK